MTLSRRQMLVGTSLLAVADLTLMDSALAQPTQHELDLGVGRLTSTVNLLLSGQRRPLRTSQQILEIARATEFFDGGKYVEEHPAGRVEYVSTALSSDALLETLMVGRLSFKFTIVGTPPMELRQLSAGTYYSFVDFIEGDFQEGRWIARVVNSRGELAGITTGVELKQLVTYFNTEDDARDHSQAAVYMHGFGAGIITIPDSTDKWVVTIGDWKPHGDGCMRCLICTPRPVLV